MIDLDQAQEFSYDVPRREVTASFTTFMNDEGLMKMLDLVKVPWRERLLPLIFYYLHWGYPYPRRYRPRLAERTNLRFRVGDFDYDLKNMKIDRYEVSTSLDGQKVIHMGFSTDLDSDVTLVP